MACILKWLLCLVLMSAVQGFSSQEAAGFTLTITPEHYQEINADETPTFNVMCVLRDSAGKPVPLTGCGFKEYFNNDSNMHFNEGPASPNYTYSDKFQYTRLTGEYQGRGLEHGECGLTFGGYRNYCIHTLGCRVMTFPYVWQTAAMLLSVTNNTTWQYHIEPPGVRLELAGSEVTIVAKAEYELDRCSFLLPPANHYNWLAFNSGPASANQSLGRYHGAGLDRKECGITLHNVQPEGSGFVESRARSSSPDNPSPGTWSFDFIELIVATAPDDFGMTDPTSREGEILNATCWSRNSRPVANITWLFDDKVIRQDSINEAPVETEWLWNHDPQRITQHLLMHVTREDNGKKLVCRVEHLALPSGVVNISKALNVRFPSDYPHIQHEPTEFKLGDEVTFTCESGSSNPPATHTWSYDGKRLNGSITSTKPGEYGGQITISNITLYLTGGLSYVSLFCNAYNVDVHEIYQSSLHLTFPLAPTSYNMTYTVSQVGGILHATCWSMNSRPLANITWLLDDKVIRQDKTNEAPVETECFWNNDPLNMTQHLLLNVTPEDNGKMLVCRVEHVALPLGVVNISKVVHFSVIDEDVGFKTHFTIAVVMCGLLFVALGVLVGFLWFYKQLCWSDYFKPYEQEMVSSTLLS